MRQPGTRVLIILFLFGLLTVSAQPEPSITDVLPDVEGGSLSGPVASLRFFEPLSFSRYGELNQDALALSKEVFYRSDGRVTEIRTYHPGGSLIGLATYEYSASGSPWPHTSQVYLPSGELYAVTQYYLEDGRLQIVEVETTDAWMNRRHEYLYDERGVHYQTRVYNGHDELEHSVEIHYNEQGLKQRTVVILPNGERDRSRQYHYTRRNLLRQRNTYSRGGLPSVYDLGGVLDTFNLAGNEGILQEVVQLSYNDRRDVTERRVYDGAGQLLSSHAFLYDYDRRGNWTRVWVFRQLEQGGPFKPFQVEVRELTYHD